MIEWKRDERRLDRLDKRTRERSLAMWNACWLYYLTEAYLEDTEKPEIRETAVGLLLLCEQAEDDDQWMGWVSSRSGYDRVAPLTLLEVSLCSPLSSRHLSCPMRSAGSERWPC